MEPRRAHMLLATLLSLFTGSVANPGQPDQLKFKLRDGYQVIARGAIAGLDEVNLVIDTGTIPSMVDRGIAKKLRLDIHESEIVAFGQKSRAARAILPDVRLGPIRADSLIAGVGDLSFLGCCVDAIIGLDVLTRRSFSIDYDHRLLTFGPLVDGDQSVPLEVIPPFLAVRLTLGGQPIRLLVDSGSRDLVLFAKRVRGRLPNLLVRNEKLLYHISGTSRLHRVLLPPLDAGGSNIDLLEGFLSDGAVDGYPAGIDGVLGIRAIASRRVDFDFERQRLRWR
jgi:hypothetical protein